MQLYTVYVTSHEIARLYEGSVLGICWICCGKPRNIDYIACDVSKGGLRYVSKARSELGSGWRLPYLTDGTI